MKMNKRLCPFYVTLLLLTAACTTATKESSLELVLPDQPNMLWLVAEDLSPEFLNIYGDSTVATPHIDRLAREGMRFDQFFSVSGVCAPSRAAIATGMYPTSVGTHNMRNTSAYSYSIPGIIAYSAVLPPEVRMHSEHLRMAGYFCTNNAKEDFQFERPLTAWDRQGRNAHWRDREDPGQPFFSIFNFEVCHESGMWRNKDLPLKVDPAKVKIPPYYPDTQVVREEMARMYSNVALMDSLVGIVLQQLEEDGLLEKTIVFWYSDNGGPLPRHKRELYDTGIRIPLVIRFPNQQLAGTVNSDLVSFTDLKPTLISLAGKPVPGYIQGQAFLGQYKAEKPRQYIHAARDRMDTEYDRVRAIRDKRFKYIRNFEPDKPFIQQIIYRKQMRLMQELDSLYLAGALQGDAALWYRQTKPEEELYDLEKDPFELVNLAGQPDMAPELERMRKAMDAWIADVGDLGAIPENELLESMWPRQIQPTTEKPLIAVDNGKISLTSITEGALIGYQIGDTLNPQVWHIYQQPLEVPPGKQLFAAAMRIGYKPSEVVTFPLNEN
jgi:arylsulfatase A-like enzyme